MLKPPTPSTPRSSNSPSLVPEGSPFSGGDGDAAMTARLAIVGAERWVAVTHRTGGSVATRWRISSRLSFPAGSTRRRSVRRREELSGQHPEGRACEELLVGRALRSSDALRVADAATL